MFIKKVREFTGLWVFDKWKGYTAIVIQNIYERVVFKYRTHYQIISQLLLPCYYD